MSGTHIAEACAPLSAYASAMQCPGRVAIGVSGGSEASEVSAYALATRCPAATRCPVLSRRLALPDGPYDRNHLCSYPTRSCHPRAQDRCASLLWRIAAVHGGNAAIYGDEIAVYALTLIQKVGLHLDVRGGNAAILAGNADVYGDIATVYGGRERGGRHAGSAAHRHCKGSCADRGELLLVSAYARATRCPVLS
eukprot:1962646-Rhodomonas_salina.4